MDLEALDPTFVSEALSRAPFVQIDGAFNVRDLHHTNATSMYSACTCSRNVRPAFLFRSGELSGLTGEGGRQLQSLGIRSIFDLRSDPEMIKYGSTRIPTVDSVAFSRTPVFKDVDYSPENMVKRYKLYASGSEEAFAQLYSEILESGGPAFREVFLHLKDRPGDPIMFNCTAGKDRTGILAALILKLVGVNDQCIAIDYSLTRIGREVVREKVFSRLRQEPMFAEDNQPLLNMFQCRAETMLSFLQMLEQRYGGTRNYLMNYAGLSADDLDIIHRNITS